MSVCCIRRQAACLHSAMEATPLARDHLNKERPRRARRSPPHKARFHGISGHPYFNVRTQRFYPGGQWPAASSGSGRCGKVEALRAGPVCSQSGDASANARGGIVYEELLRVSKRKPQNRTCWRTGEPYEGITTNQLGLDRHREHRETIQSGGSTMKTVYDEKQALLAFPVKTGRRRQSRNPTMPGSSPKWRKLLPPSPGPRPEFFSSSSMRWARPKAA
jgi:hypothetical protein